MITAQYPHYQDCTQVRHIVQHLITSKAIATLMVIQAYVTALLYKPFLNDKQIESIRTFPLFLSE